MASSLILQPSEDLVLLLDILKAVTLIVFLPGLGVIIGSASVAFVFGCLGRQSGDQKYISGAHKILSKMQLSSGLNFLFTSVPILSLALIYAQTLYGTESQIGVALLVTFLLAMLSTYFLNRYIYDVEQEVHASKVLEHLNITSPAGKAMASEVAHHKEAHAQTQGLHGSFGIVGLMLASLFAFACMDVVFHPAKWENFTIVTLLLSVSMWAQWFGFICMGFTLTGAGFMILFRNDPECECLGKLGECFAWGFGLSLPLLSLATAFTLPDATWSLGLSILSILGVGSLTLALVNISGSQSRGILASGFFVLVCLLFTTTTEAVKLTLVFRNATHDHLQKVMVIKDKSAH